MNRRGYWREAVEAAAEDAGIALAPEQIEAMASVIEGAAENIDMAFGYPGSFIDTPRDEHAECRRQMERMEREFAQCEAVALEAIRRGFNLRSDSRITIDARGRSILVEDRELLL